MTGSDKHTLDVYIGTQKKIAELSLVAGTERELALTYNSEWKANGFAISPHLSLNGDFGQREVHNYLRKSSKDPSQRLSLLPIGMARLVYP